MTMDAALQAIGDRALLLIVLGLLGIWIAHRKPRAGSSRQPPPAHRSSWRRRALWFATWWTLPGLLGGCSVGSGAPATPTTGPFECGYDLGGPYKKTSAYAGEVEIMVYGGDAQVCEQIARFFFPYQMPPRGGSDPTGDVVCKGTLGHSEIRIYDEHPYSDQDLGLCSSWLHGQWVASTAR